MKSSSRSARLLLAATLAASLVATPVALAARNSVGEHTVVDHKGANVRASKKDGSPSGIYRGHLKKGETFAVAKHDGSFCFGKAGGHVDREGWVLCGALSK